eukprot:COSAG04_NODE_134_length_23866_cov_4.802036_7_plen_79_part_00
MSPVVVAVQVVAEGCRSAGRPGKGCGPPWWPVCAKRGDAASPLLRSLSSARNPSLQAESSPRFDMSSCLPQRLAGDAS